MATMRMLIDALHPEETRVAVLDGNRLEEIDVEVSSRKQLKGNIYLAKVTRVEPSLQAAFVDYGGNRHGFLAFNEIHPDYYQIPVADREALIAEQHADERAEEAALADEDEEHGNGHAPEPESDGERPVEVVGGDDSEEVEVRRPSALRRNYKIQEVVKRRQIMLVQVVKEERGNKGAAVTTYLSLAGRYCVLMPNTARGGGVSRKIPAGKDRRRLRTILADLKIPQGMGVIVRTAGAGRSKAEIRRDYDYLLRLWNNVRELTMESIAPALVYEEANLIKRSIRDLYSRDIEEIQVEGEEGYKVARNFMKLLIPSHVKRVQKYSDESMPLFHRYQVESQQDAMHGPTVRLRSGGYIVINPTEALVAIDVNSGRSTRERNIEETALKTNLEACDEVARQLRLRDLSGLIVVDFIDMEVARNRAQVERRLKEAMRNDRARIQLGRISPFGLMELSRQRLRPSLLETSFATCTHCGGTGLRRSVESTTLHILRAIEEEAVRRRSAEAVFHVPSGVAMYILNHKRDTLSGIEKRNDFRVSLLTDDTLIPPDYRIERLRVRAEGEAPMAPVPTTVAEAIDEEDEVEVEVEVEETREVREDDGGKRKRRRRSRRRRPGDEAETRRPQETTDAEAEAAEDAVAEAPAESGAEAQGEAEHGGETEAATKRRRRGKRGGRRRRSSREDGVAVDSAEAAEHGGDGVEPVAEAPAEAVTEAVAEVVEPAAEVEVEAAKPEADAEAPAAEPKKRAPRARRAPRRKKAAEEQVVVETVVEEQAVEAVAEPLPEAKAEPAVESAPAPAPEAKAEVVPEPLPEPEPKAEPMPAPEPEPKAKAEPEPVVTPVAEPEPASAVQSVGDAKTSVIDVDTVVVEDGERPRRRGWWQRFTG